MDFATPDLSGSRRRELRPRFWPDPWRPGRKGGRCHEFQRIVTGAAALRLAADARRRQKCLKAQMRPAVLTAFIIATALFMENMDGTVLSTSLPAIAVDFHQDPIVLKLALTSYMLTLAVFIPASGWVADRFGARTVFCSAIVVFTLGSILCGASTSLSTADRRARLPGPRRSDDGAGRAARVAAHRLQMRNGQRARLSHGAGADRPGRRAAARRLHHHLFPLALDFLDQRADRRARRPAGAEVHREHSRGDVARFDFKGFVCRASAC